MVRRLTVPSTLVVLVIGAATSLAVPACGDDDDDEPMECTVEGVCPEDGRICLEEDTGDPCCPVCPLDGARCPAGCVLEFPPV